MTCSDLRVRYLPSGSQRFTMPAREQIYELIGRLSFREFQVMELVMDGLSNREIGKALSLSPRTVEIHRSKALLKMGSIRTANAICIFQRYFLDLDRADA